MSASAPSVELARGRALMALVIRQALTDRGMTGIDDAIALAGRLEAAALGLSPRGRAHDDALDRAFGDFVGRSVLARGRPLAAHTHTFFGVEREVPTRTRHGCGHLLVRDEAVSPVVAEQRRWSWMCPRCGVVGDTPAGIELPILVGHGRTLELRRLPAPRVWVAASLAGIEAVERPTPARLITRAPRVQVPLATVQPIPGNRTVAAVFVWNGRFAVSTTTLPAFPAPRPQARIASRASSAT